MSTRSLTIALLLTLATAALVAIWYSFGMPGFVPTPPADSTYRNTRFDYTFTYPQEYTLKEFSNRYLTIAREERKGPIDLVAASIVREANESAFPDFETFVRAQMRLLCAADNPTTSMDCPTVREQTLMKNSVGTFVAIYTLDLVSSNQETGAVETKTFGPVYAYNLTKGNIDAPYTALVLYSPVIRFMEGTHDVTFLKRVAGSVSIPESETAPEPE